MKECANCKFYRLPNDAEPCKSCLESSPKNWEPIPTPDQVIEDDKIILELGKIVTEAGERLIGINASNRAADIAGLIKQGIEYHECLSQYKKAAEDLSKAVAMRVKGQPEVSYKQKIVNDLIRLEKELCQLKVLEELIRSAKK